MEKRIQPLAEIRDLASAESVDAFTFAYTNLLQNHPDCPVTLNDFLRDLKELQFRVVVDMYLGCGRMLCFNTSITSTIGMVCVFVRFSGNYLCPIKR